MGALLCLICLLIFIFVWFGPVLRRQKKLSDLVSRKTKWFALFLGLIPATVVLLLCQIGLGWLFKLTGLDQHKLLMCFLNAFVLYAVVEEFTKYGFARLAIRKFETLKKIDIMVLFGFVGMGYEIAETMFNANLVAGIGRGLFIAHIVYQLVMGHFFFESVRAKGAGNADGAKRNLILALLIPILLHGVNDLFCELMALHTAAIEGIPTAELSNAQAAPIFICSAGIIVTNVVALIWGLRLAKKEADVEVGLRP